MVIIEQNIDKICNRFVTEIEKKMLQCVYGCHCYESFGIRRPLLSCTKFKVNIPDSKVQWANMEPIWGRQDPDGPHVGPINFAIWNIKFNFAPLDT